MDVQLRLPKPLLLACGLALTATTGGLLDSASAIPPNQNWTRYQNRTEDPRHQQPQRIATPPRQDIGPRTESGTATESLPLGDSEGVRLQYLLATGWDRVLHDLAEGTGSELVMRKVPPGRFARRDSRKYPRAQAVQILNAELEKVGFRLLESNRHLIVLHLRDLRAEYDRPRLAKRQGANAVRPAQYQELAAPPSGPILEPQTERALRQRTASAPLSNAKPQAESGVWVDSLTLSKSKAVDVARKIYSAFPTRAAIVQKGPEGLPAFDVFSAADRTEREFRVGIDEQQNRLVFEATPERTRSLRRLATALDQPAEAGPSFVVPAGPQTQAIAERVRPVLPQLAFQDDGTVPAPAPQPNVPEDEVPLTGALKGDVNIQNVPGVGLVITGNERDVERVLAVINRIEKLSADATPEIQLRTLKHVNSEALSVLLTEVYERYTALLTESVRANRQAAFVPIVQPNALLILAPKGALEGISALIDELDRPTDPTREFVVLRLRAAAAGQVVPLLEQFYADRGGLGTRARVIADLRTNSVIVQAGPRELTEIASLIQKLDLDSSRAVTIVRVVPLDNALAEELGEVLNEAIASILTPPTTGGGAGQGSELVQEARSTVLRLAADPNGLYGPLTSGTLTQVRITPDPRANALILTAPPKSIDLLIALIQRLDRPANAVVEVKYIPLENADATAVVELLATLFEEDQPGQLQFGGDGSGTSLVPLRFSVDTRGNAVVAVGSARALEIVEAILLRLDEQGGDERVTEVYRLRNSPALDVATAINEYLEGQREVNENDPALLSPFAQVEREVVIVPEIVSNSLIISASPRRFPEIERIILSLDNPPPQVIIQAMLVEVFLEDYDELGIELGFQDSILFDRSITEILETITTTTTAPTGVQTTTTNIVSQSSTPGFLFNNQPLGNNSAALSPGRVGTQGLGNFGVGRTNGDLGFGGLVLSASSQNVSLLLRALAQQRDVHILSRPQIRTLDSQLAEIQVGQQVPIVNGVTVSQLGIASPLVVQDQAGIILSVTPRINDEGIIVMEVAAEKSDFNANGVPIFVQTDGGVITSPIKDITTARTTVSVPNNQTIILGGMITERNETLSRKVPWLGDIPGLGQLFRYDSHDNRRTELLIFLTPRIITSDEFSEEINLVETERLHWWEDKAEETHGPIFGLPDNYDPALAPLLESGPVPTFDGMPFQGQMVDPTRPIPPAPSGPPETIIDGPDARFLPPPAPGTGATLAPR